MCVPTIAEHSGKRRAGPCHVEHADRAFRILLPQIRRSLQGKVRQFIRRASRVKPRRRFQGKIRGGGIGADTISGQEMNVSVRFRHRQVLRLGSLGDDVGFRQLHIGLAIGHNHIAGIHFID